MFSHFNFNRKGLLLMAFLLLAQLAQAQRYADIIFRVDSLADAGLPKSALAEVDKLDRLAHQRRDAPQIVRAVIYRITFQSYLQEDALVPVINTLKTDIQQNTYPVKPVLQSMLAEMYWRYYEQNRYQFNQRSRLARADSDFRHWDLSALIMETNRLYRSSLQEAAREQQTPVGILNGVLAGDTATRYLRPTLYDLLVHRALEFYLADEPTLTRPRLPFRLADPQMFADSRSFTNFTLTTTDTASTWYRGIQCLQQATRFHLNRNDREALADLDLQRLEFLHTNAIIPGKDSLYVQALKKITTAFADKPISADALTLTGKFYQQQDSLKTAMFYLQKAVSRFPGSLGGHNASVLMAQIGVKELAASVEAENAPGVALPGLVRYRNIASAHLSLFRLNSKQLRIYNQLYDGADHYPYQRSTNPLPVDSVVKYLHRLAPVQQLPLSLPGTADYRSHTAEFALQPLAAGSYVLLISESPKWDSVQIKVLSFKVSRLAYAARRTPNGNIEVNVMDRQSGEPLKGVKSAVFHTENYYGAGHLNLHTDTLEKGVTDKDGFCRFLSTYAQNVGFQFILKGDTLISDNNYLNGWRTDNDNKAEKKTILFTDRQLYRPGQTIYFKGLQLSVLNGKSSLLLRDSVELTISGANGKQLAELHLITNDFGTFSGSFVIPQQSLNGEFTLETDDGEINVRVEEYKRPGFKVEFADLKGHYRLNDSLRIKGRALAYSGYGLSQARVAYHITRSSAWNAYGRTLYGSAYRYEAPAEIAADTLTTDAQGNYNITFKALSGDKTVPNSIYQYEISADITDAGGETHSGNLTVKAGWQDVQVKAYVPDYLFADDLGSLNLSLANLNGQALPGDLKLSIRALQPPGRLFKNRLWGRPEHYLLSRADYQRLLPDYAYGNEDEYAAWPVEREVLTYNRNVPNGSPAVVDLKTLKAQPSGIYRVIISGRADNGDTTSVTRYVKLVNKAPAINTFQDWVIPVVNAAQPGQSAEYITGLIPTTHILLERYRGEKVISSGWHTQSGSARTFKIPVTEADGDHAGIQFMMMYHNRFYNSYQDIEVDRPETRLQLKLLSFRNLLQPGQHEQWKLQVTNGKNGKAAAELLAGMYDASLDDITQPKNWENLLDFGNRTTHYFNWDSNENHETATQPVFPQPYVYYTQMTRVYERLDWFGYNYYGGANGGYQEYLRGIRDRKIDRDAEARWQQQTYNRNAALVKTGVSITGRVIDAYDRSPVIGVSIRLKGTEVALTTNTGGYFRVKVPVKGVLTFSYIGYTSQQLTINEGGTLTVVLRPNSSELNQVVVAGYQTQVKKSITGAVATVRTVRIRGISSLNVSDAKQIPSAASEQLLEGKVAGLQVINDYGDQANLTDIRSGEPNKILNIIHNSLPIQVRKNFNETAFFFPQLHTDENGQIAIDFTVPESLTQWRFRAFAHTTDLASGYLQRDVITQKQLMVSAGMPRFMREGDTLTVSGRVTNLTAQSLTGQVKLQLFNAVTQQPATLLLNAADAAQMVTVPAQTNKTLYFRLAIPAGLEALSYRVTVDAGNYTDGEENTLPVLPNRMLVTESMPMMVRAGQTKTFTFDRLLNEHSPTLINKTLTLEYTQNPAWYAVQAMPYLMEFPYECSEQTFSRYFANSLSAAIVNHNPQIKQVFERWRTTANSEAMLSSLEKNPELKATLLEETPWLRDALSEQEQQKRIALLFDLDKLSAGQQATLDKLKDKQLPNGGFPWFGGEYADRYITQHIIAGIGQLKNIVPVMPQSLTTISTRALAYLDAQLIDDDDHAARTPALKHPEPEDIEIHAWYARSYYPEAKPSGRILSLQQQYLKWAAANWQLQPVYEQGLMALTLLRNGRPQVAQQIIRSLTETAQQSDEMGMYWGKNLSGWHWYQAPVETQSLMIELFTEAGNHAREVEEMKIWLLRNKQTNSWSTTKATAEACYALLMRGDTILSTSGASLIRLNGRPLTELKPEVKTEAGTGYFKTSWAGTQIAPGLGRVEINNPGKTLSWGALHWQYTEQLDKITPSRTDLSIGRKYYIVKQTNAGEVLTAVDAAHQPKSGDLLKVVVYLHAGRDYEYIQLKDMRPAGTEPVDVLSEYKYQDGLYYYQVTKDVATNFFISRLGKGEHVFEYRLRATQPGGFSTGISTVQSMYAPEFNAHSEGIRMEIGK